MKKVILPVLISALVVVVLFFIFRPEKLVADLGAFAQCLAGKGAVMYGVYWCPHCQNEKDAFGDSFRFVPYVECTDEPQKCLDAGIRGYPTWIFPASPAGGPDGRRFEGEQGIEKLSRESGCPLGIRNK